MPFRPEHVPVVPWSAQPVSKDDLEGLGWHRSGCPPDTGLEQFGGFGRWFCATFSPEKPMVLLLFHRILKRKNSRKCFCWFLIGPCLFGNVYNFD